VNLERALGRIVPTIEAGFRRCPSCASSAQQDNSNNAMQENRIPRLRVAMLIPSFLWFIASIKTRQVYRTTVAKSLRALTC
jgi:hypothetical protein